MLRVSSGVSCAHRAKEFFAKKDRSQMKFTDPFPCEHSFVEVNGYKCVPPCSSSCVCVHCLGTL